MVGIVPPSITYSVPVRYNALGETRKPTNSATSYGFQVCYKVFSGFS
jgi:hypothetical protein